MIVGKGASECMFIETESDGNVKFFKYLIENFWKTSCDENKISDERPKTALFEYEVTKGGFELTIDTWIGQVRIFIIYFIKD